MRDLFGHMLRCLTMLLLALLAVAILGGTLWYLLRDHNPASAGDGPTIDAGSLERVAIAVYLQFKQDEIKQPASDDPSPVPFTVEPGETPATISVRLERMGLIQDAQLFRLLVRYWEVDDKLEAGEYELRRNMSMEEIVAALQHGVAITRQITIPEGWRMEQVAQFLAQEGLVDEARFLTLARQGDFPYDFLRDRPAGSPTSLEGFLFPDTYQVNETIGTEGMINLLLRTFDQKVTPQMRQRAAERRWTIYEVVTLASIIEREAVVDEERPIIASVYLNRLAKGMYLQADPTVQYAKGYNTETGRWWNSMLQEEAQTVESPYNTFLYPGLPPGPICSPGLASIQAVLNPAETPYLFFFSKGDGSHAFSQTYEEHLENMKRYRK